MWEGKLLHIHIAKTAGDPVFELASATLEVGLGIVGDRYASGKGHFSDIPDIHEVTLIAQESLVALHRDHGIELYPGEHRRNLTTIGVPLDDLVGKQFMIGSVVLEGGRINPPCRYLEMLLKKKSVSKLFGGGSGLNCTIIAGGSIETDAPIRPV